MLCCATQNLKHLHANFRKNLIPNIALSGRARMHSNIYFNESEMVLKLIANVNNWLLVLILITV